MSGTSKSGERSPPRAEQRAELDGQDISADEVREWLCELKLNLSEPDEAICSRMAAALTRIMDPSRIDPSWRDSGTTAHEPSTLPEWWDFDRVAKAATVLSEALPTMRAFIESLFPTDEIEKQREAIRALPDVLAAAMPFIQHPLGEYQKADRRPKDWHNPAFHIAFLFWREFQRNNQRPPAVTNQSRLARVVCRILTRMSYINGGITPSAIGQYLDRRFREHGLKTTTY